jgi:hypothetical protein
MKTIIERCWAEVLADPGRGLAPGRPPTNAEHAGDDPPPGKNWVLFDFPPGATPEEIACILMESLAKHPSPKGEDDDA